MNYIFDTHGGDSGLNHRSGQRVKLLRELTESAVDISDVGKMYEVQFSDGYITDAFADELIPESGPEKPA